MEHAPQPRQDILTEAQSYESMDAWLTTIPDERIQQFVDVLNQLDNEEVQDEDTLAHLVAVAMHFSGNIPMTVPEVTRALGVLSFQIGLEAYVRNGVVSKTGRYSMRNDERDAYLTLTDKGQEIYGSGGNV